MPAYTLTAAPINIDAGGDGIDSNGSLYVSGGEIYVSGPESNADGALDYDGEATITGGSLIAAGASGMAQNFGSSSTQGSILVTFTTQSAGTTISLLDESGNELISWQSGKTYNSVVISSPDITVGSTYTIKAGGYETTVTMDSVIYGNGMGIGGGFPGGNGGMGGQRPDRAIITPMGRCRTATAAWADRDLIMAITTPMGRCPDGPTVIWAI